MTAPKLRIAAGPNGSGKTTLFSDLRTRFHFNVERVRSRAQAGGHDVPEHKIVERYHRSLGLLPRAVGSCRRSFLFDNSEKSHRFIAEFEAGQLIRVQKPLPSWFVEAMLWPQGNR